MSKPFKLLTILLAVIFCFSALTLTVWAIDADGDGYDDETGEIIGGNSSMVDPEPVYTDPPVATDPPVYTDPYVETDPPIQTEPVTDYVGSGGDYSSDGDESDYVPDDYDEPSYDEPSYLGGGQSYVPPASTAPSVPLIKTDDNIDDSELSGNDWKDISANLKNASSAGSDGDDFSFIQNNNSADDNGQWLLIFGVGLVVLSLAGITYFILSGVMMRKKLASAGVSAKASDGQSPNRYRASNDYGDGYKTSKKEEKKINRSRRYDTAEINLPKSKKNNTKNRYR